MKVHFVTFTYRRKNEWFRRIMRNSIHTQRQRQQHRLTINVNWSQKPISSVYRVSGRCVCVTCMCLCVWWKNNTQKSKLFKVNFIIITPKKKKNIYILVLAYIIHKIHIIYARRSLLPPLIVWPNESIEHLLACALFLSAYMYMYLSFDQRCEWWWWGSRLSHYSHVYD